MKQVGRKKMLTVWKQAKGRSEILYSVWNASEGESSSDKYR